MPRYRTIIRAKSVEDAKAGAIRHSPWGNARNPVYAGKSSGGNYIIEYDADGASGEYRPFGIGSASYKRRHAVDPRSGMPRK